MWGFVDRVTSAEAEIEQALREREYDTTTRGRRRLPAAHPAGEGVYVVTLGRMHLSYALCSRVIGNRRAWGRTAEKTS